MIVSLGLGGGGAFALTILGDVASLFDTTLLCSAGDSDLKRPGGGAAHFLDAAMSMAAPVGGCGQCARAFPAP